MTNVLEPANNSLSSHILPLVYLTPLSSSRVSPVKAENPPRDNPSPLWRLMSIANFYFSHLQRQQLDALHTSLASTFNHNSTNPFHIPMLEAMWLVCKSQLQIVLLFPQLLDPWSKACGVPPREAAWSSASSTYAQQTMLFY